MLTKFGINGLSDNCCNTIGKIGSGLNYRVLEIDSKIMI